MCNISNEVVFFSIKIVLRCQKTGNQPLNIYQMEKGSCQIEFTQEELRLHSMQTREGYEPLSHDQDKPRILEGKFPQLQPSSISFLSFLSCSLLYTTFYLKLSKYDPVYLYLRGSKG